MRFIGERKSLSVRLQARIAAAEERTAANSGLRLQVAMSYGGRWDVVQAAQQLARECASGALRAEDISEARFGAALALAGMAALLQFDAVRWIVWIGGAAILLFLTWKMAREALYPASAPPVSSTATTQCWPAEPARRPSSNRRRAWPCPSRR